MLGLQLIKQQIKLLDKVYKLGKVYILSTKKEIRHLPKILFKDETLQVTISGRMDGNTWIIALTDKRIIFLNKGMIYGIEQKDIPLEKVNSIESKTGIIFGEIRIWDGASHIQIEDVTKKTVQPFVVAVNDAISAL